jgi:hypothetical protein
MSEYEERPATVESPFARTAGAGALVAPPSRGSMVAHSDAQRAVAELQMQITLARANPRDPVGVMDTILQDCMRPSLAEEAVYDYARGGSAITGPSIRLAEAVARRWGNIRSGIREVRHPGYSECVAYAWELESGYYDERVFHVEHVRDTKLGRKLVTDERDIYELVANVGQRRKRAVLQSIIPGDVFAAAVAQCEATMKAKADTSPAAMQAMCAAFEKFGITRAMIEARIQRRLDAITPAQIVALKRVYASLRDEMSSPGQWFDLNAGAAAAAVREALKPASNPDASAPAARPRGRPRKNPLPAEDDAPPAGQVADPETGEVAPPAAETPKRERILAEAPLRERILAAPDFEALQSFDDTVGDMPSGPERDTLLDALRQRDRELDLQAKGNAAGGGGIPPEDLPY